MNTSRPIYRPIGDELTTSAGCTSKCPYMQIVFLEGSFPISPDNQKIVFRFQIKYVITYLYSFLR